MRMHGVLFEVSKRVVIYCFGCRLFHQGIGLHLIEGQPLEKPAEIDPRADHISFQVC